MGKMKQLEDKLEHSASHNVQNRVTETGKLDVNGPLPADFNSLFAQSVAKATMAKGLSCPAADIHVVETNVLQTLLQTSAKSSVLVELVFQGPAACVNEVQQQAGLPDSPLVRDTPLYTFLVAKEDPADVSEPPKKVLGFNVRRVLLHELTSCHRAVFVFSPIVIDEKEKSGFERKSCCARTGAS